MKKAPNKIHQILFHTESSADTNCVESSVFVGEIHHSVGSCFNLLNLSCTVIPTWISALNQFLSQCCSSDKFSHSMKTENALS